METLLSSCNLSHLAPSFAEQELTLPLLRSMAGAPAHWEDSMEELGVHAADAARLQQALLLAQAGAASTGVESGAGTATRAPSGLPPATFAQASISDLVASALSIVAATPAVPVAVAEAAEKPYRQGFSVTHINHVTPPQPKDSDALAAYKRRQLQQQVQQTSSTQAQAQRGGPASKPQARYSPAPHAARTTRPLDKFSSGGVVSESMSNACPSGGVVQVPSASARADVFGAPASCCPTAVDEAGLD